MSAPVLVDLYCGRGGWSRAALARGWECIGYDITDHGYPGRLILQSLPVPVASLLAHRPALIVASPPCEEFARAWLPWLRGDKTPAPEAVAHLEWSLSLIGCGVRVIVECSRFAARHVPGARAFGAYALWGDVPAIAPTPRAQKMRRPGTDPAARAMIPRELAEWIVDIADPRERSAAA